MPYHKSASIMAETKHSGFVDGHGKLHLDKPHEFKAAAECFAGKRVVLTLGLPKRKRSNGQNNRAWSRIVNGVRGYWFKEHDIRVSKNQCWARLKAYYLGVDDTPLGPEPKESKRLAPGRFADLMDEIEADFATEKAVNLSEYVAYAPPDSDDEEDE